MVSIKELAQRCGVSVATVSKALNDKSDIGEETKKRIREIADEMGYFPNASARTLRSKRSYSIGVLFGGDRGTALTDEFFPKVLNAFKLAVEKRGYEIIFINKEVGSHTMTYLEHCRYRNFDGVVIVCASFEQPEVQELMSSKLPVVTIDYVHDSCTAVSSNNVKCMTDLMDYIIGMGHKKIAYIHGQDYSTVTRDRLAAYYRVMEAHGIEVTEGYIKSARYLETEEVAERTKELLEMKDRPTCILFPDDMALIGGLNVIRAKGLKIPKDISIAGYDGSRLSQMFSPKLTTIKQDTDQIGKEAADRLISIIEKPKTALMERVVIEGILLKGESVGRV